MRPNPRNILITFFSLFLMLAMGGISDIAAQGKGKGGGGGNRGGGGEQPKAQRQAAQQVQQQRQQPQMQRQQAQRPQMHQPQIQRQERQAQRQQPRFERPQQVQRQQPRFERPQVQRQQPQIQRQERQAQRQQPRFERPQQVQRQQPRFERQQVQKQQPQIQRQERQAQRQQRPQVEQQTRASRGRGNQNFDLGREARTVKQVERQLPSIMRVPTERGNRGGENVQNRQAEFQRERGSGRAARLDRQSMMSQDRVNGRQSRANQVGDVQTFSADQRRGGNWRDRAGRSDTQMFSSLNNDGSFFGGGRGQWGRNSIDPSSVDLSGFRSKELAWRQQARSEGWAFDENEFRSNAYDYTVREAWRDDVLRSVINVNIGYPNDYYYIAPPSYPAYWGVNYQPWYYNVGYTYYDPYYSNYYVQPYYMAYAPYDYYYSSYYYDDPYYFNDPYDDYVTYRIFSSNSVGGFVTRLLGSLLATGYDQGYRDGLLARQSGYAYTESYYDPYSYYYDEPQYETVTYYEPYLYGSYEDRHCLSKGYELGYQDAFYGQNDTYDPYYAEGNLDIVSLYVGTTFTFNV